MDTVSVSSERQGDFAIISITGSLTAEADEDLSDAVKQALESGIRSIILDMAEVIYINSSGFGILIGVVEETRRHGGKIKLVGLTPHFKKTAKLIGLHRFTEFCRTVEDAMEAF